MAENTRCSVETEHKGPLCVNKKKMKTKNVRFVSKNFQYSLKMFVKKTLQTH